MRLYGEEAPGAHPTIASVWTGRIFSDSIEVTWRKGNPSTAVITYGRPGGAVEGVAKEMGQEGRATLCGLTPDTMYQFRIVAASPQGYQYYSPWYLVRTRAPDGTLKAVEPMQHFGTFDPYFLPVADAPLGDPPERPALMTGTEMSLENGGFERDVTGWRLSRELEPRTSQQMQGITPHEGKAMFGWYRVLTGTPDNERHRKDRVTQRVPVTPGKWYQRNRCRPEGD